MIITCGKCKTRYRIKDAAVQQKEFRARCLKCNHVFLARKPDSHDVQMKVTNNRSETVGAGQNRSRANTDCKVITVCNQKGGVAKTTTCLNLGVSLAQLKKRVLLIDFDIQANLSLLLGYKDAKSFFEAIHSNNSELPQYIVQTKHDFWLLPSNSKMALLSKKYLPDENFEYMLREKLQSIKHNFDYILIDTPPSGDFYTLNALLASDVAMIPAQCEYLSMNGVNHIAGMVDVIKEKTRHEIDYRVLITMYDKNNTAGNVILNNLNKQYSGRVYKVIIEKDQKIQESQVVRVPTINYSKDSLAGLQYHELAKELMATLSFEKENSNMEALS